MADYRKMWEELGMDLETHDQLCAVLPAAFGDTYLSQENRPENMAFYDFVVSEIHGVRPAELIELQSQGGKVFGTFCVFVPDEVVVACGGAVTGLCGGSQFWVPEGEKVLPSDLCPLVKASLGAHFGKTCPYFSVADMYVGETTCDGKKKAYDILGADKRTYVHWAEKKYDIIVFGMPTNFHYGNGMGTNPIQMMRALSAQVIRHKRILSDRCVFIVSSICDGYFHDERWPYLRELYDMFQHDYMQTLPDMNRYGEYFATNEEYIRKYRFCNAFHPFHGFSMMSCGHIAEMNTSAIYIVGAREPGIARGMGLKTRATFEEALEDTKKKIVGPNPNILALPRTFTTTAVHLCMKDPSQNSHSRDGIIHPCGG